MPGSQQNGLLVRTFNFDAVSFNARIIFERLMDNSSIKSGQWFQLHYVAPAAYFLRRFFGFLYQGFARLGSVPTDIDHNLRRGRILLKKQPIGDVLKVSQGLALASN